MVHLRQKIMDLVQSMVFYMLLRVKSMIDVNIAVSLSRFSLAPHSGWKETLQKFGYKYIKADIPKQYPRQETDKKRQRETLDMADKVNEMYHLSGCGLKDFQQAL